MVYGDRDERYSQILKSPQGEISMQDAQQLAFKTPQPPLQPPLQPFIPANSAGEGEARVLYKDYKRAM